MGNWGRLWGDRGLQKPLGGGGGGGGGGREAYGAIISCAKVLEYMGL